MRKLFSAVLLFCGLALTGCDHLAQYTVSEDEINKALQKHNNYEKDLDVAGLITAHITLSDLKSQIGREEPDMVVLAGKASMGLNSLFGQQQADIQLTMKGQPSFDREKGAIYLKNLQIVDAKASPEKVQSIFDGAKPLLENSLREYFNQHPAYILSSDRSEGEAVAKKFASGLEIKPGKIIIPLAP